MAMKKGGEEVYPTPWNGYYATRSGKIWSAKTNSFIEGKIDQNGYRELCIMVDGQRKYVRVHIMIARTFLKKPTGKGSDLEVNHKDKNKLNNKVSNLEWATPAENSQHRSNTDTNGK